MKIAIEKFSMLQYCFEKEPSPKSVNVVALINFQFSSDNAQPKLCVYKELFKMY